MNSKEVIEKLLDGYKLRKSFWHPGGFIYMSLSGRLHYQDGVEVGTLPIGRYREDEWEVYKEPEQAETDKNLTTVKYKLLYPDSKPPKKAEPGAAAWDLHFHRHELVLSLGVEKISLGIALEIPPGYVGKLYPRSSVYKSGTAFANSVGIIDSTYRGELMAVFLGTTNYTEGDRCCQLIIEKLPDVEMVEAEELSETERGAGGFGSTGVK